MQQTDRAEGRVRVCAAATIAARAVPSAAHAFAIWAGGLAWAAPAYSLRSSAALLCHTRERGAIGPSCPPRAVITDPGTSRKARSAHRMQVRHVSKRRFASHLESRVRHTVKERLTPGSLTLSCPSPLSNPPHTHDEDGADAGKSVASRTYVDNKHNR